MRNPGRRRHHVNDLSQLWTLLSSLCMACNIDKSQGKGQWRAWQATMETSLQPMPRSRVFLFCLLELEALSAVVFSLSGSFIVHFGASFDRHTPIITPLGVALRSDNE